MEPTEIHEFSQQMKEAGESALTSISLAISILAVLVAIVTGHRPLHPHPRRVDADLCRRSVELVPGPQTLAPSGSQVTPPIYARSPARQRAPPPPRRRSPMITQESPTGPLSSATIRTRPAPSRTCRRTRPGPGSSSLRCAERRCSRSPSSSPRSPCSPVTQATPTPDSRLGIAGPLIASSGRLAALIPLCIKMFPSLDCFTRATAIRAKSTVRSRIHRAGWAEGRGSLRLGNHPQIGQAVHKVLRRQRHQQQSHNAYQDANPVSPSARATDPSSPAPGSRSTLSPRSRPK